MTANELALQVTQFLAPLLPFLLKAGEEAAREAGKKFGEATWKQAQALWAKLQRKPSVAKVAETAAAVPDNQALLEALRKEIAKALQEDPTLATEVTHIVSRVEVGDVLPGGEVTGVEVKDSGAPIHVKSEVKAGDVSGRVTGVKYEG